MAGISNQRIVAKRCLNLAMKTSLHLTWSQLRKQKRFLKTLGIRTGGETADREEQKILIGDHLEGSMIEIKANNAAAVKKKYKLCTETVPLVKVKCLRKFVQHLLHNYEISNELTWDTNGVPEDEIWVKIGGDHGGGSFKMCLQILNINAPNDVHNTHVFLCYTGRDMHQNLCHVLQPMANQIRQLQLMTWKGKRIRVFLNGDYEFLCKVHGISGAKGTHCCVWCEIVSRDIQQSRMSRGDAEDRTLVSMILAHKHFVERGNSKKTLASHYKNCIHEPLWSIRISHTAPPYLHIMLGIVKRHHDLLTAECHALDIIMAEHLSQKSTVSLVEGEFADFVQQLKKMTLAMNHRQQLRAADVQGSLHSEIRNIDIAIDKLVKQKQPLSVQAGPVVRNLDVVLQKHNIKVQAYHSRSFVGNHCHQYLKKEVYEDICKSILLKVRDMCDCSATVEKATQIGDTFSTLNAHFAKVHMDICHSNYIPPEDYHNIGSAIDSYMCYYRSHFPGKVLPKHHILEDHILPWITRWGQGLAFHGEQGVESAHKMFNRLELSHSGIQNKLCRLMSIMKENHTLCSPQLRRHIPIVQKRTKSK